MAFIETNDYTPIIKTDELNVITGSSVTTRQTAESMAINKIKHRLSKNYDVDAIFGATGSSRDLTIVEYTIYYTLYILYTSIARAKVPDDRFAQYQEAERFFKAVAEDKISTNLPRKTATDTEDYIDFNFGSDTQYSVVY